MKKRIIIKDRTRLILGVSILIISAVWLSQQPRRSHDTMSEAIIESCQREPFYTVLILPLMLISWYLIRSTMPNSSANAKKATK